MNLRRYKSIKLIKVYEYTIIELKCVKSNVR